MKFISPKRIRPTSISPSRKTRGSSDTNLYSELAEYSLAWGRVLHVWVVKHGAGFESGKGWMAERLYTKRGKWARPFSHMGMAGLSVIGVLLAPVVASGYSALVESNDEWQWNSNSGVLLAAELGNHVTTMISDKPRSEVLEYVVQEGETLSSIAEKFDVSVDTILWENNLGSANTIKPGQTLRILPVEGVRHKVKKGETIYSVAKKYNAEPQAIVDFPFNSFANDETFALEIGQELMIPDGEIPQPKAAPSTQKPSTSGLAEIPSSGAVSGSGQYVWPAGGRITQRFSWYHKAIDIANKAAPGIVAADSGRVIVAGWPDNSGYGNRVMIDHGNGYVTLYAHLQKIYVSSGQYVNRGEVIGQMGSTGRSTGTHLHFEIRGPGGTVNPLSFLQ